MFARKQTSTVEIGGESFLFHKLSGNSLDRASAAKTSERIRGLREMGGEVVKAMFRSDEAKEVATGIKREKTLEERRKARYDEYDRTAVVIAAEVEHMGVALKPEDVTGLDFETLQGLYEAIVDFSLPALDPADSAVPKG